jgi:Domain of unknown function (DUF4062)
MTGPNQPALQGMYRIFLSSTRIDLLAHRTQVHEVLERLEQFAVDMAQFGAQGSGDAVTVSLEKVRSAQVYLGIIAWRYGYVPVLATFHHLAQK